MTAPDELMHYGILRKSGRYPWGSGNSPYQSEHDFSAAVEKLKQSGLSETEIARGFGMTTTELRQAKSIAKNAIRAGLEAQALRLKDKGMSNVAIGERMGINESSVRSLLNPAISQRRQILEATTDQLRAAVTKDQYLDIGAGNEIRMGISKTKLNTAVSALQAEGYEVYYVQIKRLGTDHNISIKVLAPPGTEYNEVSHNQDRIKPAGAFSEDGGRTFNPLGLEHPKSISSKDIQIVYGPEGGSTKDGLIELRPGVDELSLGSAHYAQVRIAVDDTHYIKGMAVYSDDLPKGVNVRFNTNKTREQAPTVLDALKPMKTQDGELKDNPFGSVVRQKYYKDASGKEHLSALNIVNEEGSWDTWAKSLSSQMLSKQPPSLVKQQLDLSLSVKRDEYDEISKLTNPTVKKRLLESFADDMDSSATHLKAAGLPRTKSPVIIPVNSMKPNEIYAPGYKNGESVVLIRHPHGGIFEIPELKVNNKNPEARKLLGTNPVDAVAIHHSVAERLSGADFDGDTVLVIPNNRGSVKTSRPLKGLVDFDPKTSYPKYDGMKVMRNTQNEMGKISNLITDMTIKGAPDDEIARAVRHSMVVIDAEKHELNYKQSAIDNGITQLKNKYQRSGSSTGAATLISRASSDIRVPQIKPRLASQGGPVDAKTGAKVFVETGDSYVNKEGKTVEKKTTVSRMSQVSNARELSSGTAVENVYADYANQLKSMANTARKEALSLPPLQKNPTAQTTYANEVDTLRANLNRALKNAPLERKAQLIANTVVDAARSEDPTMTASDSKKVAAQALVEARARLGSAKERVPISPKEWEAIQSGAVSNTFLKQVLDNTDLSVIKQYATPRTVQGLSDSKIARAKAMLASGYTQADVAEVLGVSTTTISKAIK